MSAHNDLDRLVTTWLDESAGAGAPDYLAETLDGIERTSQRPPWLIPGRWLPMQLTMRRVAVPRAISVIALLALILAALVGAALIAGGRHAVPAPFGLAKTGLIATDAAGDIVLVDADGSRRTPLAPSGTLEYGATWSLDGLRLAYWSEHADGTAALYVVDADGTHRRQLGADLSLLVDVRFPAVGWSPDSSQIAFATFGGDLYVAAADGSTIRRVNGTRPLSNPAFSPDGSTIVAYSPAVVDRGVYVLAPDGTGLTRVSSDFRDDYDGLLPAWSPDGRLAYQTTSAVDGTHDIVVATRGPGGWTERTVVGGPEWDAWPRWSNDGRSIAFVRSRPDTIEGDVFVVDAAGGAAPRQIGHDLVTWAPGCFTPDDSAVVILAGEPSTPVDEMTDPHLLVIPTTGDPAVKIAAPGIRGFAACSVQRLAP